MSGKLRQDEADNVFRQDISCKTAKMFYDGQWACAYGCLGLGDCFDACKFNAIDVYDGLAHVDRDKCVGCGACKDACPNDVIEMVNKKNLVLVACKSTDKGAKTRKNCETGCIGCMKCQKTCKFDAITIENNLARIDQDACRLWYVREGMSYRRHRQLQEEEGEGGCGCGGP